MRGGKSLKKGLSHLAAPIRCAPPGEELRGGSIQVRRGVRWAGMVVVIVNA